MKRRRTVDEDVELSDGTKLTIQHDRKCPRAKALVRQREREAVGPAQVATDAYRSGWDVTFGGRPAVRGEA